MSNASEPLSIKQKGAPAAYAADLASYVRMEANLRILEGIAKGEMTVLEGRVVSHEEAKIRMSKWLD